MSHINRARKDIQVSQANLAIDTEASYNYSTLVAMLRSGRALMFSYGYRPIGGQQHKTVVEFCGEVLGKEYKNLTEAFDRHAQIQESLMPSRNSASSRYGTILERAKLFVEKVAQIIQAKIGAKVILENFVVKENSEKTKNQQETQSKNNQIL